MSIIKTKQNIFRRLTWFGQNLAQNHGFRIQILADLLLEAHLWQALALRWLRVEWQTRYLQLSESRDLFISVEILGFAFWQIIQNGVRRHSCLHFFQIRDVSHPTNGLASKTVALSADASAFLCSRIGLRLDDIMLRKVCRASLSCKASRCGQDRTVRV